MRAVRFAVPLLLTLPLFAIAQQPTPPPASALTPDEQALKNAGLKTDGPSLLEFFRKRTLTQADPGRLQALVRQLADKGAAARDTAAADLVGFGSVAVPALRQAANDLDDAELAARARQLLQATEGTAGPAVASAAARMLTQARPQGAAEVLLAYLPFADDDQVTDEVGKALAVVAVRDGKPEPVLLKALQDEVPVRRAVAAEVLCRAGGPDGRTAVRSLLADPKPTVRLRTALALADTRDAESVGVLIDLLAELPAEQARQVEEFLSDLAGEWAVRTPQSGEDIARKVRRETWAAWWRVTDGPALLDEFRKRSLDDAGREKAQALLGRLGEGDAESREKALTELLALGPVVAPLVRLAAGSSDAKISQAAQKALRLLTDRGIPGPLPVAAPRLLAVRKPQGAAEALLAYLPFAEDEGVAAEAQAALAAVAVRDGKLEPALARALQDKLPLRRAAAAEAVIQAPAAEQRDAVRSLLKDPDASVRARVGLALAWAGDREAVPVLIALLGELPPPQATPVEDYLRLVAGDKAPDVALGADDAARQKARDAWAAWWQKEGATADLARVDPGRRLLGFTLIVDQYDPGRRSGRVFEVDSTGRTRWSVEGLQGPCDAQVLPGDRVLIAEQNINRVSERDLKGKVLWERTMPTQLIGAQRLANGNTFIAARGQLLEVDRDGKEVFSHVRVNQDVMAGQRLRDGQYVVITYGWQYARLDAAGKEQKTGRIPSFPFTVNPCSIEVLPNDRVLVAQFNQNKVTEVDLNGKVLWEATVQMPMSVSRLPNGNTLVGSTNLQRVTELDRTGKVVWEFKDNMRAFRARRR